MKEDTEGASEISLGGVILKYIRATFKYHRDKGESILSIHLNDKCVDAIERSLAKKGHFIDCTLFGVRVIYNSRLRSFFKVYVDERR